MLRLADNVKNGINSFLKVSVDPSHKIGIFLFISAGLENLKPNYLRNPILIATSKAVLYSRTIRLASSTGDL
jgi:hypothetical protein